MWEFLARSLEASTIFTFAGLGELIDQRSGVLNVGIEGVMLFGATLGFIAAQSTGSYLIGLLVGIAIGGLLGLLHGFFSVTLGVDQVVSGMGIWILGFGLTTYIGNPYTGPLGMDRIHTILGLSPFFYLFSKHPHPVYLSLLLAQPVLPSCRPQVDPFAGRLLCSGFASSDRPGVFHGVPKFIQKTGDGTVGLECHYGCAGIHRSFGEPLPPYDPSCRFPCYGGTSRRLTFDFDFHVCGDRPPPAGRFVLHDLHLPGVSRKSDRGRVRTERGIG